MSSDQPIEVVEATPAERGAIIRNSVKAIREALLDVPVLDRDVQHTLDHIEYYLRDIEIWSRHGSD